MNRQDAKDAEGGGRGEEREKDFRRILLILLRTLASLASWRFNLPGISDGSNYHPGLHHEPSRKRKIANTNKINLIIERIKNEFPAEYQSCGGPEFLDEPVLVSHLLKAAEASYKSQYGELKIPDRRYRWFRRNVVPWFWPW